MGTSQNSCSETQDRNNPAGACPWKQILTCVGTCTEQSQCWSESQETQNSAVLQIPIVEGAGTFQWSFRSSGYVHRIDSAGEVFWVLSDHQQILQAV